MNTADSQAMADDYRACEVLAQRHYENFPVVAWWLPRHIRSAVAAIYAFARSADDFADEGDLERDVRLQKLAEYQNALRQLERGEWVQLPGFLALGDAIQRYRLPFSLFHDLLSAFIQDVKVKRYSRFEDVQAYCRCSANPIGELMLRLHGIDSEEAIYYSDNICSALQWINFLQDLAQDFDEMQRIYIPQEDLVAFGVSEEDFFRKTSDDTMSALVLFEILRVRKMLLAGLPLETKLRGRFKWMISITVRSGIRVLENLEQAAKAHQVFSRPRLSKKQILMSGLTLSYGTLEKMRQALP